MFSTAPTTATVYLFNYFSIEGSLFLSFEQAHKGERDFFDAAIFHESERQSRAEWDGLFRGLAYALAGVTLVALFLKIPLTWEIFVLLFGGVGTVVILLGVAVAAAWSLWGKGE